MPKWRTFYGLRKNTRQGTMTNTKITRRCFDPWDYIEFRSDGRVAPCCARESFDQPFSDLNTYRNNTEYRNLREQLMEGNLDLRCSNCPFREKIPVEMYKKELQSRFQGQSDLLTPPQRLLMVRIDFTEKCNLRCTYCAASQPNYIGVESSSQCTEGGREMPAAQLENVIETLVDFKNIDEITVNGHGETTSYEGWHEYCNRLQQLGLQLTITSNFSRKFHDREIVVLSRFKSITISIDTDDPLMLKKIRRKVNLGDILVNITKIRASAMAEGRTPPDFIFLSGIYDKNVIRLSQFAWFAVACGVKEISFWKLIKRPDIPGVENVHPLTSLDREELLQAYDNMQHTKQILTDNGLRAVFTGGIMEEVRELCNEFITINIKKKDVVGRSIDVSIEMEPFLTNEKGKCNIYAAYETNGTIYFLKHEKNKAYTWDRESEAPPYRETTRTSQEVNITFPLHDIPAEEISACYVGCGNKISEVMEKGNYVMV